MAAVAPKLERTSFATRTPDVAREFLQRTYGSSGLRIKRFAGGDWSMRVTHTELGYFALSDVELPAEVDLALTGSDDEVVIATILSGRAHIQRGDRLTRYGTGDTFIANRPGARWTSTTLEIHDTVVNLPTALLRDVAGETAVPWRPVCEEPRPDRAGGWRHVVGLTVQMFADPELADSRLIVGPTARLLAAAVLTAFPSAASPDCGRRADGVDAHPAALRRAQAFIDANPDLDITLSDIARAARVSPPAVQRAFRRHLDTTVTAYLRQVRLHHAHEQLVHASPQDTTVAQVARRWGFSDPSGFAHHYRAAFGRSPADTLAR